MRKMPHLADPGLAGEVNFSHCLYEIFHLTCHPRVWQVRFLSSYKQALTSIFELDGLNEIVVTVKAPFSPQGGLI